MGTPRGNAETKALSSVVKLALPAEIEGEESHCGGFYILKTGLTTMYYVEAATVLEVSSQIARGNSDSNPFEACSHKKYKQNFTMHLSSAIVFTVVATALVCSAVKASPISLFELDDEPSIDELKAIPPEQGNNFKRICGLSLIGCRRKGKRKRTWEITPGSKRTDDGFAPFREGNGQEY